jgi:hypothetical protein
VSQSTAIFLVTAVIALFFVLSCLFVISLVFSLSLIHNLNKSKYGAKFLNFTAVSDFSYHRHTSSIRLIDEPVAHAGQRATEPTPLP